MSRSTHQQRKKTKFDRFWDIGKNVIQELTAVDDRGHTQGSTTSGKVVVNMAIAILAGDLYDKCKNADDDDHYANAVFKYAREYAVSIRGICSFVCTDDKHKISMGQPNFPLGALPRGRRVLVEINESFQVGDHDFTTISLISTVILVNDIPERLDK